MQTPFSSPKPQKYHELTYYQASQDHRGTPTAPGRVVTLIERTFWASLADAHDSAPSKVWGIAYRIARDKVAEVKEYLDIREINGYSIHYTPWSVVSQLLVLIHPADGSPPIRTLVYIGTPDNDQFTGPQDPQALAQHIYVSEGPSGLNRDYLLELEKALDGLSGESGDAHVTDLSERVREIERRGGLGLEVGGAGGEGGGLGEPVVHDIAKVSSVEEQEETEKVV
ncbi:Uu.00g043110.m01.CDS01 [Anthostomella pinea]|uniref:glutathione-specific gamma-glutamylcyclotransferase n=1 Tax=Anthostomella pinea TaxID=933095 RepID=A0AAI8V5Q3_9PEZI|nr:Uu.00g043110.m01.CDS01 [Anthostomella pinea]